MNTYNNMIIVIDGGKYSREDLLNMSDVFFMRKRITESQYSDLVDRIEAKYPAPEEPLPAE